MRIAVASKNPVKTEATKLGFNSFFNNIEIVGIDVESGVSNQPMSDEETFLGAKNRAENAKKTFTKADFWVGIEGGIQAENEKYFAFAWIYILSEKRCGKSRTTTFEIPHEVSKLINKGMELGEANDIVFNQSNSKQKNGAVGLLTHNVLSRKELYKQAILLALIPFVNPERYNLFADSF